MSIKDSPYYFIFLIDIVILSGEIFIPVNLSTLSMPKNTKDRNPSANFWVDHLAPEAVFSGFPLRSELLELLTIYYPGNHSHEFEALQVPDCIFRRSVRNNFTHRPLPLSPIPALTTGRCPDYVFSHPANTKSPIF